ncbi:hypothetical protein HY837_02155 [archaeon]|nr:hypothetical protein [archaeon]
MSYKLIAQFKDFVRQESIDSILQSDELKRLRWGSGLKADKIFDLPLNASSEEIRRLARSYEFNEYPDGIRMENAGLLSTLKIIKKYLEQFKEIYFIQIETHNTPVEIFKNYN